MHMVVKGYSLPALLYGKTAMKEVWMVIREASSGERSLVGTFPLSEAASAIHLARELGKKFPNEDYIPMKVGGENGTPKR